MGNRIAELARLVEQIIAAGGAGEIDELLGLALVLAFPAHRGRRRWWRIIGEPMAIGDYV